MDGIARMAERKILEALERGELDDLPGKGRPLDLEDDDPHVPEELRMAYRVLKNAGCVPPELELHQEIVRLRSLLASVEDPGERRVRRKELEYKVLKFNVGRKRPLSLEDFPGYREKVERRLGGSDGAAPGAGEGSGGTEGG